MYTLEVVESFTHPDGREFVAGHPCQALNVFEVAELLVEFPNNFKPGDDLTKDLAEGDSEQLRHYADAAKRKREEEGQQGQGALTSRKVKK